MKQLIHQLLLVSIGAGLVTACGSGQFPTVTIYETPARYVRLEFDQTVRKGAEHSHPISVPPEQIAAVLGGIIIEAPLTRFPVYDDISQARQHAAFTEKEVTFFAPLLALALSKATPEEVVTFYQTRDISAITREVTSGGVFVQGDELHLILANYRSHTRYMADMGVADTQDDRLTPMESLAPQEGKIEFEPRTVVIPVTRGLFDRERRELIIKFRQLAPHALTPSPAASTPTRSP